MRSHPLAIASRFSPISLEEMDLKAALQTRLDNKYYVTRCVFEEFAQALQSTHAVLDIEGDRVFGYDTVYFDTDALELYQAHIQQRRKRFKVRTRYYRESALCFFEVKLKGGRGETIKKKIECEHANVLRITAEARDFIRGQVGTYYGRDFTQPLRPSLSTTYRRMTLVANETQERITCDFDLAFAGIAGIAGIAGTGGRTARMRDEYVLVEIKSERGSGASDRLMWRLGARPVGGSKYCLGISLLRPGTRSNGVRRHLGRCFGWPSSGAAPSSESPDAGRARAA